MQTFPQDFVNGEKLVVYPVFWWLLHRMPENHKRVYLARFLTRMDVPDDLRVSDDGVRDLCSRYEQARVEFIATHKRVDMLREANADPQEQRRRVAGLETEMTNLTAAIAAAGKKLSSQLPTMTQAQIDAFAAAAKSLRAEREEGARQALKLNEQQAGLVAGQQKAAELSTRLNDVKRDVKENRVEALLQRMNDELSINIAKGEQQLPLELNERRAQIAALTKVWQDPVDMGALSSELAQLDADIAVLTQKVTERQRPSDDGTSILILRQHAQKAQKRKGEVEREVSAAELERSALADALRQREQQLAQLRTTKVLKGDEFKRYANSVRTKTMACKTMRARLGELHAEIGVLQFTEKTIHSKHQDLQEELKVLETRLGMRGYVATSERLSEISEEKNIVEQSKGKTLEELAVIVQDLVNAIRDRKETLGPKITELRTTRQSAQMVEQEHTEKKDAYEYQHSLLMQEVTKLEGEVSQLTDETRLNESMYHRLHAQQKILSVQKKRVDDEKEFRAGTRQLDPTARTNATLLHSTIESLDIRNKELQKRRRDIEETHDTALQQVEWFTNLRRLMEAKHTALRVAAGKPVDGPGGAAAVGGGSGQVGVGGAAALDMDIQALMGTSANVGARHHHLARGVDSLVF
jgi:intraflagellar transport protein 81